MQLRIRKGLWRLCFSGSKLKQTGKHWKKGQRDWLDPWLSRSQTVNKFAFQSCLCYRKWIVSLAFLSSFLFNFSFLCLPFYNFYPSQRLIFLFLLLNSVTRPSLINKPSSPFSRHSAEEAKTEDGRETRWKRVEKRGIKVLFHLHPLSHSHVQ